MTAKSLATGVVGDAAISAAAAAETSAAFASGR
ncbi:Uncharacterised protein [Mycobacterium tuberculosis]|uniref:Uncharacterized protein n=1 Tax=Mycobacterium tuberculosis TaxID=1773 RepID=A0A654TIS2_MYCTX|nr:Uncharacterised protein [Mycobacterium tuberculosis]CKR23662.1 Uncharacterised protein [Mycobacterium tuberculosis]CKT63260.1 Uncharacterised protein [Mycobacterium tuberculosis]CNI33071.1 Uncharacterised protein [Mycobacterium tuberculosis]